MNAPSSTTDAQLAEAVRLHEAGKLDAADAIYRLILADKPDQPDALHLAGMILHQRGRSAEARGMIERALVVKANNAAIHSNYGVVLRAIGERPAAATALRRALAIEPNYGAAAKNLATVLSELGQTEDAIPCFRRAVELMPQDAGAMKLYAVCLAKLKRWHEAAEQLTAACALAPRDAEAHCNLGVVLVELDRMPEAIYRYRKSVELLPEKAEYHNNLGIALTKTGNTEAAEFAFREAVRLQPNMSDAQQNLGVTLRDQCKIAESLPPLRAAVRINPASFEAWNNLGAALQIHGDLQEAVAAYDKCLSLAPKHIWARFNRSTTMLLAGDYANGWREYESRFERPGLGRREFAAPLWKGESLPTGTLLLHAEQGLGDTFQFIRYAAQARERVGRVIVECQPALLNILKRTPGIDQLIGKGSPLPACDAQLSLMSLPLALGLSREGLTQTVPYVSVDESLVRQWRERMPRGPGEFRIGINWQGNPKYSRDKLRSIALSHFGQLAKVPGVRAVSLQKGIGSEQMASAGFEVTTLADDADTTSGAFMDTAAIMAECDLIVTSDTAIAHLAGAMGRPTWLATAHSPDWRWGMTGETTPWYPTMRHFRQPAAGDWAAVFEAITGQLRSQLTP